MIQRFGIADAYLLPIELNPVFSSKMLAALERAADVAPEVAAMDETFWEAVRREYLTSSLLNLNNGGVSPQPLTVQEAQGRMERFLNHAPAHHLWGVLEPAREIVRARLAQSAGANSTEIAIVRNTTEAMANLIYGLPLKKGDVVLLARQDYPNMIELWRNRAERDGLTLKWIDLPLTTEDDEELVEAYRQCFGPEVKALNLTHMINWTGRLMPVREIASLASAAGIMVVVDAAHTYQQLPFSFAEIPCMGIGTVLHKWLCGPFGTGMIYIPENNIEYIRPIFPLKESEKHDIRKFEGLGTRNYAAEIALVHALDFMEGIGIWRKFHRFQFLKNFWVSQAQTIPRFKLNTPLAADKSGVLVHFTVEGIADKEVETKLMKGFDISVVSFEWANVSGLRASPNLHTSLAELERFVEALRAIAG